MAFSMKVTRSAMQSKSVMSSRKTVSPMKVSMRTSARAPKIVAQAQAPSQLGTFVINTAKSLGMPTDSGFFGFTPFAEVWTGRWAMLGFMSSVSVELATGKGTLQQIGLDTPSPVLLFSLLALVTSLTALASAYTSKQLLTKEMDLKDMNRYRNFLGLKKEEEVDAVARNMKAQGDFTTPSVDTAAIAAVRASGMPADQVLGAPLQSRATTAEASTSAPDSRDEQAIRRAAVEAQWNKGDEEDMMFSSGEARYARTVELQNGRAAMVGFLAAVLIEAGTGQGIIGQCFNYAKASGLLGQASGF